MMNIILFIKNTQADTSEVFCLKSRVSDGFERCSGDYNVRNLRANRDADHDKVSAQV